VLYSFLPVVASVVWFLFVYIFQQVALDAQESSCGFDLLLILSGIFLQSSYDDISIGSKSLFVSGRFRVYYCVGEDVRNFSNDALAINYYLRFILSGISSTFV
jgi:hypothetical protein